MENLKTFTEADIKALDPCEKIGLLATIDNAGFPHITLITSIQPVGESRLAFGEFSHGQSKENVRIRPECGFLMMTADRSLWRGTALWKKDLKEGPEYVMFNEKPMFRYNSYFGINTVHYLDLVKNSGRQKLPLAGIVKASLLTAMARGKTAAGPEALSGLALSFFNSMASLKFLAYIDSGGYPFITPVLQCRAVSAGALRFSPAVYEDELSRIAPGSGCAVLALTLGMESVLVKGRFTGIRREGIIKTCGLEISCVYNSMPPVHGQIYPPVQLEPFTHSGGRTS